MKRRYYADRCSILFLLKEGRSASEVAREIGLARQTVYLYMLKERNTARVKYLKDCYTEEEAHKGIVNSKLRKAAESLTEDEKIGLIRLHEQSRYSIMRCAVELNIDSEIAAGYIAFLCSTPPINKTYESKGEAFALYLNQNRLSIREFAVKWDFPPQTIRMLVSENFPTRSLTCENAARLIKITGLPYEVITQPQRKEVEKLLLGVI